ncbi:MAG: hypothetical protein AAF215_18785 [Cyanobacteria bacterium P01_A01_bin.123]
MNFERLDEQSRQEISRLLQQFAEVLITLKKLLEDGVVLQECRRILAEVALWEAQRYGLTVRQAEVWRLRRLGYQYEQIAAELVVTVSTVKQHLNAVHQKQAAFFLTE